MDNEIKTDSMNEYKEHREYPEHNADQSVYKKSRIIRGIKRLILGQPGLQPLSRMDFLPKALVVYFVRQPIAIFISNYFFDLASNYGENGINGIFILAALLAEFCYYIPYIRLVRWRTLATIFSLPSLIMGIIISIWIYLCLISPDATSVVWAIMELSIDFGFFLLLFLLPDKKSPETL